MTAQPVHRTCTTATRKDEPGSVASAWHLLDEVADARFLPSGLPLALRWRGCLWQVIGEPVAWSSSSSSWELSTTPPGGTGSMLTTRFWRFQAQTGPASPVLEFDMSVDPRWQDWRLRRIVGVDGFSAAAGRTWPAHGWVEKVWQELRAIGPSGWTKGLRSSSCARN